MSFLQLAVRRGSGLGDIFDDMQSALDALWGTSSDGSWSTVSGGAYGGQMGGQIEANGSIYQLPAGVFFPPNGWSVMAPSGHEQWLINAGARRVGRASSSQTEQQWLNSQQQPQQQQQPGALDPLAAMERTRNDLWGAISRGTTPNPSSSSNTLVYVGLGLAAVLVIAAMKK